MPAGTRWLSLGVAQPYRAVDATPFNRFATTSVGLVPSDSLASTSPACAMAVFARHLYFPFRLRPGDPFALPSSIIVRSFSSTAPRT